METQRPFRVLPTLEHLKLIRFNAPYGQFVDMIATRWWRIRERETQINNVVTLLGDGV